MEQSLAHIGNSYITSTTWYQNFIKALWNNTSISQYSQKADFVLSAIQYPFKMYDDQFSYIPTDTVDIADSSIKVTNSSYGKMVLYKETKYCTYTFSRNQLDTIADKVFTSYSTLSKYKLYLPFHGYIDIDSDLVVFSNKISIEYWFDYTTGRCCVNIIANYEGENIRVSEYYFDVGYPLYVSSADSNHLFSKFAALLSVGVAVGGAALGNPIMVTSGVSSAISFSSQKQTATLRTPSASGRLKQSYQSIDESEGSNITTKETSGKTYIAKNRAYGELINGLANFANSQRQYSIRASQSGNADCFNSILKPYILACKPKVQYYEGFNKTLGRPLNAFRKLKKLRGYTKVSSIHLNIPCLSDELSEITELLYSGVILNTDIEIPDVPEPVIPTPPPDIPIENDPISPNAPTLPEGEVATMLCCFNGKFRVTGMRGKPSDTGRPRNHYGLDLVGMDTSVTNTPVYAISSGWVKLTDQGDSGLGKCVRVQMDNQNYYGEWILYGHLSKFEVKNGQYVEKGQLIGLMGNTGDSDGWHTHLEWRNKYDKYDPDFSKYDICKFTGIPNTSVEGQNVHIGSPIYKTANGASVQNKLGLENQTIEYLENYKYADDLMKKIDDHTK